MNVQRQISCFRLSDDELIGESSVDHIPLQELKRLFSPPADDPLLYNPYEIDACQAGELAQWITLSFDFTLYSYYLECFQA